MSTRPQSRALLPLPTHPGRVLTIVSPIPKLSWDLERGNDSLSFITSPRFPSWEGTILASNEELCRWVRVTASLWHNQKVCCGHFSSPQLRGNRPQRRIKHPSLSNKINHINISVFASPGLNIPAFPRARCSQYPLGFRHQQYARVSPNAEGTLASCDCH